MNAILKMTQSPESQSQDTNYAATTTKSQP